jgi:hypothetical protein
MESFWVEQRARLNNLFSVLPLYAKVPCLILFWSNSVFNLSHTEIILKLELHSLPSMVSYKISEIEASLENFDSSLLSGKMLENLAWLIQMSPEPPQFSKTLFEDLKDYKLLDHVDLLAKGIRETFKTVGPFGSIFDSFNLQIWILFIIVKLSMNALVYIMTFCI